MMMKVARGLSERSAMPSDSSYVWKRASSETDAACATQVAVSSAVPDEAAAAAEIAKIAKEAKQRLNR